MGNTKQKVVVEYVQLYWGPFFQARLLDYTTIDSKYKSNSLLEAYNARIKTKLPRKPIWPNFIQFLKDEEQYYNREIERKAKSG